jgi:hypothetical protein
MQVAHELAAAFDCPTLRMAFWCDPKSALR